MSDNIKLYGQDNKLVNLNVTNALTVTPNDDRIFAPISSFHVNTDGNIKVQYQSGNVVIYTVVAGTVYPYKVVRIYATDTTVGNVIVHP